MLAMETSSGGRVPLDVARWHAAPCAEELALLAELPGPVLDVGCGPGRLVAGLQQLGRPALGIDVSATAVRTARRRGAMALARSVFDRVPGEGRWASVLLFDGNVGIGGDPAALLARARELADPQGTIVVEAQAPGVGVRTDRVRLQPTATAPTPWFDWAWVSIDALLPIASSVGLHPARIERWGDGGEERWIAWLQR